jgi:acyl carrier protein
MVPAELNTAPAPQHHGNLIHLVRAETAAVLGQKQSTAIGLQAGFFELGMDSLMAVELRNRLERITGLKIRTTAVFDYPNVEALAEHLAAQTDPPTEQSDVTLNDLLESKLEHLEHLLELAGV